MASPLGHLAAAAAVYLGFRRKLWPAEDSARPRNVLRKTTAFAAAAFFSLLPDSDASLGIFFGDLGKYHNNLTHSLFVAVAVAAVAAIPLSRLLHTQTHLAFRLALLSYGVHIVMDFFTVGRGVMLFWPLTDERFQAPVKLFYGLHWSQPGDIRSHIITLMNEGAWIALACAVWWRWRKGRRTA